VKTSASYANRSISPEEQALYDHLLEWVADAPASELLARFQSLFINGTGYPDRSMSTLLDQITAHADVETYFHHILNRCCHILVNRWQTTRQTHGAIAEL